jgi:hypothetical protein
MDRRTGRRGHDSGTLDIRAGHLKEMRVVDTGRAGGLTGQTTEAVGHLFAEGTREFQLVVGDSPHQCYATPGAVLFVLGDVVSRAGGKAHPAVHALLEDRIIEVFERLYSGM